MNMLGKTWQPLLLLLGATVVLAFNAWAQSVMGVITAGALLLLVAAILAGWSHFRGMQQGMEQAGDTYNGLMEGVLEQLQQAGAVALVEYKLTGGGPLDGTTINGPPPVTGPGGMPVPSTTLLNVTGPDGKMMGAYLPGDEDDGNLLFWVEGELDDD